MFNLKKKKEELSFPTLLKRCLLFTVIFALLTVLLVLILSAVFYNTENPNSKTLFISVASLYLSAFISAFILSRVNGGLYFWGGLILGAIVLALVLLLSIFIKADNQNIFLQLALPAITVLGALLGQKREKKHKRRKSFNK